MKTFRQFIEAQIAAQSLDGDAFIVKNAPKSKDEPDDKKSGKKKSSKKLKGKDRKKPEDHLKSMMTPDISIGPNA